MTLIPDDDVDLNILTWKEGHNIVSSEWKETENSTHALLPSILHSYLPTYLPDLDMYVYIYLWKATERIYIPKFYIGYLSGIERF